jgi:uncharacterized protein DUF1629
MAGGASNDPMTQPQQRPLPLSDLAPGILRPASLFDLERLRRAPARPRMSGDGTVAYFVDLPVEDDQWLAPKFEGGKTGLTLDMEVGGHLFRGVDLQGCFTYHIRVPPKLIASVPTRIVVTPGSAGYLPDFGVGPWGGWTIVSSAFVDIVEALEPGVHQFLPIAETADRKGRAIEKRFFMMNILREFNAIDVERSSVAFKEDHYVHMINGKQETLTTRTMSLVEPHILVLKRSLVAGHHLWHGSADDIYRAFFSKELRDAVQVAGLSPLQYFRAEEV